VSASDIFMPATSSGDTCRRPLDGRSFRLRGTVAGLAALAVVAAERPARADCEGPRATIRWSYPDATTVSVPPDAVFWAVSHAEAIDVTIDGVPLIALGTGPVERQQFVAQAPLAEGEHVLVAYARTLASRSRSVIDSDERQVRFRVAAGPPVTGDVSISSVEVYPFLWNSSTGEWLSPPQGLIDQQCGQQRTSLEWSCDDIIPSTVTLVTFDGDGDAIAYLTSDGTLVPPSCTSLLMTGSNDPASYRVTAVLPTGLSEEHTFTGAIEEVTLEEARPDLYANPREGMLCSLGLGRRSSGALGVIVGLSLVACWARRRRR
jgi:hypothetical protein